MNPTLKPARRHGASLIPPLVAATILFWSTDLFASFTLGFNQEFSGGTAPISAADFFFQSFPDGGHGPFYAAAHVQNTGFDGNGSGWIAPVPEPTTLTLAAAMLTIPFSRRALRSFRKKV